MLGDIAFIIAGLLLLVWGADRFVHGAGAVARNMGVSPLLIGLTIVAFATSAPEIVVSVLAASRGEPHLAIGNAIGSNSANIGLVLGCLALLRPVDIGSATLRREMPALLAVSLLAVSLFLDAFLGRGDGLLLLAGLAVVMVWLTRLGLRSGFDDPLRANYDAEIPKDVSTPMAALWLTAGLVLLLIGAELLINGATSVALALGISQIVVGVTVLALGTSLPELAVSIVSVIRKEYGMAVGNIVGSNIFNLLAVVGVAATIHPAELPTSVMALHLFVMSAFTLALFAMTYEFDGHGRINRLEGGALLLAYLGYMAYVVAQTA